MQSGRPKYPAQGSIPAVWRNAGRGEEGRLEGEKKSLKTAFEKKNKFIFHQFQNTEMTLSR